MSSSDLAKLLDNGCCVVMFRNSLGSYTAFLTDMPDDGTVQEMMANEADDAGVLTDDFTPDAAIRRLADKAIGVGEYSD